MFRRARAGKLLLLAFAVLAVAAQTASASLGVNYVFNGHGDYSADGFGSTSHSGSIQAEVPAGSAVERAFLYETFSAGSPSATQRTVNFDGTSLTTTEVVNGTAGGFGASSRIDVTNQVSTKVGSGG